MDAVFARISTGKGQLWATIFVASLVLIAFALESWLLLLLPVLSISVYFFLKDYSLPYKLFFVLVPFSVEYYSPGGFGTDLPTEPLMLVMTGTAILLLLRTPQALIKPAYLNPITALLLAHIFWIFVTMLFSSAPVISLKYFVAKLWYIIPFYFLSIHLIKNTDDFRKIIRLTFWPLFLVTVGILIRHSMFGFTFESANHVVTPIFRNHVSYASALVLFLPFIWFLMVLEKSRKLKLIYMAGIIVFVTGIYFSYTRAAILAALIALVCYFLIRYKLFFKSIMIALPLFTGIVYYLIKDNNYVNFAPDFERTVMHSEFSNLLDATYKLEDISTMERVYRWVAGSQMFVEKPWLGFGPGSFYSFYKNYTVNMFETYVSDNPEHSGIHNNFLMILVEQGIIGLLIFLALSLYVLYAFERQYLLTQSLENKRLLMSGALCTVIILLTNLINDTIEVDKIGPFFFLSLAILSRQYTINKSKPAA